MKKLLNKIKLMIYNNVIKPKVTFFSNTFNYFLIKNERLIRLIFFFFIKLNNHKFIENRIVLKPEIEQIYEL